MDQATQPPKRYMHRINLSEYGERLFQRLLKETGETKASIVTLALQVLSILEVHQEQVDLVKEQVQQL